MPDVKSQLLACKTSTGGVSRINNSVHVSALEEVLKRFGLSWLHSGLCIFHFREEAQICSPTLLAGIFCTMICCWIQIQYFEPRPAQLLPGLSNIINSGFTGGLHISLCEAPLIYWDYLHSTRDKNQRHNELQSLVRSLNAEYIISCC